MTITSKSTKAEIYAAYKQLLEEQQVKTITKAQVTNTARVVATEADLLVRDCKSATSTVRQWVREFVDTMRQPVLRSARS